MPWTPDSWKEKQVNQDVVYPSQEEVNKVLEKIQTLPPLVSHQEVDQLRELLKQVANRERFLVQGGDCAELFSYCQPVFGFDTR
jgi:3-deoxy-7-phosphoheptulonate synthase